MEHKKHFEDLNAATLAKLEEYMKTKENTLINKIIY